MGYRKARKSQPIRLGFALSVVAADEGASFLSKGVRSWCSMPVRPVARLFGARGTGAVTGAIVVARRDWAIHPIGLQLSCRGCTFMTWPYPSGGTLKCKFGSTISV